MRRLYQFIVLLVLWIGSAGVCKTYSFVPSVNKRQLEITRTYELELTPGKKNVVYLPALMSFYGATNEQEITSSQFTYSVNPDSVTVTADYLEIPRKYYCLTWNTAPAESIQVEQKMTAQLLCRNTLYTQATYPYDPSVLEPFGDYLKDDSTGKMGRVLPSDQALVPICEDILKQNPASAEEVVELACDWVNDNVKFGYGSNKSSQTVLEARKGHCLGMALLAAAIVRKLDIPADAIKGKFLNSPDERFHGMIEVYFPDAGWVIYDLSNWQRGFKFPNCLLTAGRHYRIEVEGQDEPKWVNGYFCKETTLNEYKKPVKIPLLPIRATPKTKSVYGVKVSTRQAPESVRVRRRPLRELTLDTSVEPGVRPYLPQGANDEQ